MTTISEMLARGDDTAPEGVSGANDSVADRQRGVSVLKTMSTQRKMRLLSEAALSDALDWHLEDGIAYHVISAGDVDRFDFYVGEIFKDGYRGCIDVLDEICGACGGRVARFRNHSKLMCFFGDRYCGVIESSANVDTNPRTEQTCITLDRGLAEFYLDYFDGINDFDGRYPTWKPWERYTPA